MHKDAFTHTHLYTYVKIVGDQEFGRAMGKRKMLLKGVEGVWEVQIPLSFMKFTKRDIK